MKNLKDEETVKDSDLIAVSRNKVIDIKNDAKQESGNKAKKNKKISLEISEFKERSKNQMASGVKDSDLIAVSKDKVIDIKNVAKDEVNDEKSNKHAKKPDEKRFYHVKSDEMIASGAKDSDLIAVSKHQVIDMKNDAAEDIKDENATKIMKKMDKRRIFKVKTEKQKAAERFINRVLQLFSAFTIVNLIAFFFKPLLDRIVTNVLHVSGFSRTILTFRYGLLWALIIVLLFYPVYNLGYREAKKKDHIQYKKVILLFLAVDVIYVLIATLFMRFIGNSAFFAILAIPYCYLSAYFTGGQFLFELIGRFELLKFASVAITFQIVVIPSFLFFVFGYKKRLIDREKSKNGQAKRRSVFIINPDSDDSKSGYHYRHRSGKKK